MKSVIRSALAAVAAGVALAGCATYYNGYSYGYDSGAYSYDYGPYYYGPPAYVAPSIGLGFTYRDRDWGDYDRNYDRNYNWRRDSRDRHDRDYRRDNDQWRGDHDRAQSAAPLPSGRDDPWGGSNIPFGRNSQQ